MLSVSRNVFRSESECKGTTFSRNTKQNKNFFYEKRYFFSTKRDSDAFLGNYEKNFECKVNNITNRGTDGSEEKLQYWRRKIAIPPNKY